MQETINYDLKKPEENEWADVEVLNENMDKIDEILLKKADKSITKSATLLASAWTGTEAPYTLRLTVAEATATNNIEVNPPANLTIAQRDAMCNADIDGGGQGEGYIELIAYDEKPTIDLPVILIIRGD